MLDERQRKTREALFSALEDLLAERPYGEINVTDLAGRAGIGRQTFYRHFESVDAMLRERLRIEFADQMKVAVSNTSAAGSNEWFRDITLFVFKRVAEQPRVYRLILRGEAGGDTLQFFREQIAALWSMFQSRNPLTGVARDLQPFVVSFHAGAIAALLLHWIENDCSPSAEKVTGLFLEMANRVDTSKRSQ